MLAQKKQLILISRGMNAFIHVPAKCIFWVKDFSGVFRKKQVVYYSGFAGLAQILKSRGERAFQAVKK